MKIDLNAATGANTTTTSTQVTLPPTDEFTVAIVASQPGTWVAYGIEEVTGARIPLFTSRTLSSTTNREGATVYADSYAVLGQFSALVYVYTNTNNTAGVHSGSVQHC